MKINRLKTDKGMIMILNTLIFISILIVILIGVSTTVMSRYSSAQAFAQSKQAYLVADSGISEAYYRLKTGLEIPDSFSLYLSSGSSTIQISDIVGGKKISVSGDSGVFKRKSEMNLSLGTGISFHYGIQSGAGGFELRNSSTVTGNVFSEGPIIGAGNTIYGDVVSAGPTGRISGIHATGTAFAHNIQNSTIDKDAYYTSISGTTVGGTMHPGSPDQPIAPMPITDEQILEWENQAQAGGEETCVNGSFNISGPIELGPIKIPCDLNINGTAGGFTVIIKGPVWVEGNITVSQKAKLAMDPNLASRNVAIIADDHANGMTKGLITLSNQSSFEGSGAAGSFVFMISQNRSGQNGGSINAIAVGQSSSALIGYAIHGLITLAQSVSLKEVTAYKIVLTQSSNVTYDKGLPNTLFSSGPGGGYDIIDWLEI